LTHPFGSFLNPDFGQRFSVNDTLSMPKKR